MNLIQLIPTGKIISKPQIKLLEFISSLGLVAPSVPEARRNPFSGVTHTLDPLACALYDFITQTKTEPMGPLWYVNAAGQKHKVLIGQWNRARYLFLHLWPDQYYDLLD